MATALGCGFAGPVFEFGTLIVEGDVVAVDHDVDRALDSARLRITEVFRGERGSEIRFVLPGEIPGVPQVRPGDHVVISLDPATVPDIPGGGWRFAGVFLRRVEWNGREIAFDLEERVVASVDCTYGVGAVPTGVNNVGMTAAQSAAAFLEAGGPSGRNWSSLVADVRACAQLEPSG